MYKNIKCIMNSFRTQLTDFKLVLLSYYGGLDDDNKTSQASQITSLHMYIMLDRAGECWINSIIVFNAINPYKD